MSDIIVNGLSEKQTGCEIIPDDVLERYSIDKKDLQQIYNNYKLYSRVIQYTRNKDALNNDEAKQKYKQKYYCELCDKDVRISIKYHHIRTMKHLKFKDAVDKKMKELNEQLIN